MNPFDRLIPPNIHTALQLLRESGHKAYLVGGCVRDALMGKAPHDWDIATSAEPAEVKRVFAGHEQVDDGIKHGTVMVILDHEPVEITSFRIDGTYTDGRRPDSVSFTTNLREDLARRDFTINACAVGEEGIVDPYGGRADIEAGLIRCVGDPSRRFTEDALRILRGMRFASLLGFRIDEETKLAMFACRALLKNVSQERITAEFRKTLLGIRVAGTLTEFHDIVLQVIPEIAAMAASVPRSAFGISDEYASALKAIDAADQDLEIRTALFLIAAGKIYGASVDQDHARTTEAPDERTARLAEAILRRMKYPTAEIRAVCALMRHHAAALPPEPPAVKRMLHALGAQQFRRLLALRRAALAAQPPACRASGLAQLDAVENITAHVLDHNECYQLRDLAVSGSDLAALGIPTSPLLGKILQELLDLVIDGLVLNQKEPLLLFAQSLFRKQGTVPASHFD